MRVAADPLATSAAVWQQLQYRILALSYLAIRPARRTANPDGVSNEFDQADTGLGLAPAQNIAGGGRCGLRNRREQDRRSASRWRKCPEFRPADGSREGAQRFAPLP